MPRVELERWFGEVAADLGKLGGDAAKLKKWRGVHPGGLTLDYSAACLKQQWAKVVAHAAKEVTARRADLQAMKQRQARIAALAQRGATLRAASKGVKLPPSSDASWSATRTAAAAGLDADGKRELTELGAMTVAKIEASLEETLATLTGELDALAGSQLAVLGRATLAYAVARFNEHFAATTAPAGTAAAVCTRIEKQLDTAERGLWTALKQGTLDAALDRGGQLSDVARAALDEALPHAAAVARKRRAAPRSVDQGRLAIRLGALLNALLRAVALGDHAAWVSGAPAALPAPKRWIAAAKKLAFPSAIGAAKLKPIKTLATRPTSVAKGTSIGVEGVLEGMGIFDMGAEKMWGAGIVDAGGAGVNLGSHDVPLDRGGLVPGAYARVSGTWADPGPALWVGALKRADLAKKSWSDWATAELKPFGIAPTNLAATWSWEPGDDGAANPVEYGVEA